MPTTGALASQPAPKAIGTPAAMPPQRIQRALPARDARAPAAPRPAGPAGTGSSSTSRCSRAQRIALGLPGGRVVVVVGGSGGVHGDRSDSLAGGAGRPAGARRRRRRPSGRAGARGRATGATSRCRPECPAPWPPARRRGLRAPPAAARRAVPRAAAAGSAAGRWPGRDGRRHRAVHAPTSSMSTVARGGARRTWLANTLCMSGEEPGPQVAARRSTAATCCRRAPACPAPGRRRPRRRPSARAHSAAGSGCGRRAARESMAALTPARAGLFHACRKKSAAAGWASRSTRRLSGLAGLPPYTVQARASGRRRCARPAPRLRPLRRPARRKPRPRSRRSAPMVIGRRGQLEGRRTRCRGCPRTDARPATPARARPSVIGAML